jgi:hypothetical protein
MFSHIFDGATFLNDLNPKPLATVGFVPAKFLAGPPRYSDLSFPFQSWGYPGNIDQGHSGIVCSGDSRGGDTLPCRSSHGASGGPLFVSGFLRGVNAKDGAAVDLYRVMVVTNFGENAYNLYRRLP